jgi:hypothetical protein
VICLYIYKNHIIIFQGGSTAGERSLTAFVLAALLEARVVEGVSITVKTIIFQSHR